MDHSERPVPERTISNEKNPNSVLPIAPPKIRFKTMALPRRIHGATDSAKYPSPDPEQCETRKRGPERARIKIIDNG